jgi:D-alanine-D-alanine ligase-like ATP-grasp enzyme
LNKPSGSPNAQHLQVDECDSEMIAIACRAAMAMRRNVAGVDILQDKVTKKWYVIEVNNNPDMTRGLSQEHKQQALAAYLKKKGQQ